MPNGLRWATCKRLNIKLTKALQAALTKTPFFTKSLNQEASDSNIRLVMQFLVPIWPNIAQ